MGSCLLIIKLTIIEFLAMHPGGAKVILRYAGKDATKAFDSVHAPEILGELPKTLLRGHINPNEVPVSIDENITNQKQLEREHNSPPPLRTLINLYDFEKIAQKYLPDNAWAYYSSGADDEISKRNNSRAFSKIALRPRALRKIPSVNTATSILGFATSLPVYVSPVGIAKFAHPDGECALAAAAGKEGLVQVLANGSSMPIERVMKTRISSNQPIFQQLYINKEIERSAETVRRAEKAGAGAIWITVDSPVVGKREMDERLNLAIPVFTLVVLLSGSMNLIDPRLLIVTKRDKA
jgi:L-lactate dehydrogenase (cytochrome)